MAVLDVPVGFLDNESDLLDWLCDELVSNHHFTDERDTGTVGSNDKERWIERPAVDTFHGTHPLVVGMRTNIPAPTNDISLQLTMTHEDYDTASATDTRVWADFTGTPTDFTFTGNSSAVYAGGMILDHVTPPYVQARLITSPNSETQAAPEELYFYLILETTANNFTCWGFGEVVKLVNFAGGMFQTFNQYAIANGIDTLSNRLMGCGTPAVGQHGSANDGNMPGAVFSSDWGPPLTDAGGNGWLQMHSFGVNGLFQPQAWPIIMNHPVANLGQIIARSPSGFSLQSQRWPCVGYGSLSNNHESGYLGHAPMCVIPDLYIADITNVDAYGVFQEANSEKFQVLPYLTKAGSGAGSSEKFGLLIRNPDLVVTINP